MSQIILAKPEDNLLSWPTGIETATELFQLKISGDRFSGLLRPDSQSLIFSYGRPALLVHGGIEEDLEAKKYWLRAAINSIDDDYIVFHYPPREKIDAAREDMEKFAAWVKSLNFRCPWPEEIANFCRQNGCWADQ